MEENKMMLFDNDEISRAIIMDKANKYFDEYEFYPTRIYIPKTVENKWSGLGSVEWDRLAGEIAFNGLRSIFKDPPVFLNQLLIIWNSDELGLEYREEDVDKLAALGCDVRMHKD